MLPPIELILLVLQTHLPDSGWTQYRNSGNFTMCWKNQFTKLPKEKLPERNFLETSKKNSNDQYTGLLHLQIQRKAENLKKKHKIKKQSNNKG